MARDIDTDHSRTTRRAGSHRRRSCRSTHRRAATPERGDDVRALVDSGTPRDTRECLTDHLPHQHAFNQRQRRRIVERQLSDARTQSLRIVIEDRSGHALTSADNMSEGGASTRLARRLGHANVDGSDDSDAGAGASDIP
jgi:hypothetical protein